MFEARLMELEPVLQGELVQKVEPYPEYSHVCGSCLSIAKEVVASSKDNIKPAVEAPLYPPNHRIAYSRDGCTVVVKNVDSNGRAYQASNPLGPAIVSVYATPKWCIDGIELTESEWRQKTQKS